MAFSNVVSNPVRFAQGQTADDRHLLLDVFGGEVITAFDLATVTLDKHQVKTVSGGARSWRFPKTWKATAEYHQPGQEMLGTDIDTTEVVVTVDDILVSHTALADIDRMLSHFDVRGEFSTQMGRALARVYDKNVFRQLILAARTPADGPFPGGGKIEDSALAATNGVYDGIAWIDAIRQANLDLFDKDVPEDMPRYLSVNARVFDAIKYAKDSNGQYLILNRDFGHSGAGGVQGRAETLDVDGVTVVKSRNMPNTDETSDTSVYSKYRADYSNTVGILWTPMAVATVKVADIAFETERDVRRQEDFMVAKMLVGHGTLRPECAIEFAVPASGG